MQPKSEYRRRLLINVALRRTGPVWRDEFFDHVLRSNDSLVERADYVCQNPSEGGAGENRG